MKEDEMKEVMDFLISKGVQPVIPGSAHYTYRLTKLQHLMFGINVRPLVGVRKATGYFTADTYVLIPEKSTAGVPYWEHLSSPFGFSDYNEALVMSIRQGIEYVKEMDRRNNEQAVY